MAEAKTYRIRTAVTPEDVRESTVTGVLTVSVESGVLTLRSKSNYVESGSDDAVLAVYSNGSWVDAVQVQE